MIQSINFKVLISSVVPGGEEDTEKLGACVAECFLSCLRLFSQPWKTASEVFNVAHSIKVRGRAEPEGAISHISLLSFPANYRGNEL